MKRVFGLLFALVVTCGVVAAQNTNSSTTTQPPTKRQRTAAPTPTQTPQQTPAQAPTQPAGADAVLAAFNALLDGIRKSDVDKVMSVYWKSPQLNLFNYNGTVTKSWEQVRKNRESSYPEIADVKLDVRDVSITMLGRDGAVVSCLWTQSQNYKGTPETVAGRMTLVFKRFGTAWKAIHLHSSSDNPNPAVIPPSEQRPAASPSPSPTPEK